MKKLVFGDVFIEERRNLEALEEVLYGVLGSLAQFLAPSKYCSIIYTQE